MDTKAKILRILTRTPISGAGLAKRLGISRQAVHTYLKELVLLGQVAKIGTTRAAVYELASHLSRKPVTIFFSKKLTLAKLAEDEVFRAVARQTQLDKKLPTNVWEVVQYGFTEMLNNAIEHSRSRNCSIQIRLDPYVCTFTIRDFGIGLFHSVASKFDLPDESAAVGELLKGKTTTMAERHTGEGIFFTSKAADLVSFRSHRIELIFDGRNQDAFVKQKRFLRGTEVDFEISRRSRRKLQAVFEEFAPADLDYRFDKTRVLVKLFHQEYVSRSEARRLLAGLEKFKLVELDFRDVKSLGQGFADEIFRVYRNAHPGVEFRAVNLSTALQPMIRHVLDNYEISQVDNLLTINAGKLGSKTK